MKKNVKNWLLAILLIMNFPIGELSTLESVQKEFCSPFEISADFLYWSADYHFPAPFFLTASGTDTVFEEGPFIIDVRNSEATIKTHPIGQKWSPGIRVGLGWMPGCDYWDIKAIWTYLHSHSHKEILSSDIRTVFPSADAFLNLEYNVIDLELGKTIRNCSVLFRPFFGIRTACIKQDSEAFLRDNIAIFDYDSAELIIDQSAQVDLDQKTWAAGPRMGLDTVWGNFCGFSLIANASASLLYGSSKSETETVILSADDDLIPGVIDIEIASSTTHDKAWGLFPTLQMLIGLSWSQDFGSTQLHLDAGWESTFWWNALNAAGVDPFSGASIGKAVALQGVTIHSSVLF